MLNRQMELSLKAQRINARRARRLRAHATSARWWFDRMRDVVDRAIDFPPSQVEGEAPAQGVTAVAVLS
jgi:hypothetical protein